jgi:hypothetical protein
VYERRFRYHTGRHMLPTIRSHLKDDEIVGAVSHLNVAPEDVSVRHEEDTLAGLEMQTCRYSGHLS